MLCHKSSFCFSARYGSLLKSQGIAKAMWRQRMFKTIHFPLRTMAIMNLKSNPEIVSTLMKNDVSKIRNIGIIAHVDHGKTTLVDCMLKQSGVMFDSERAMDKIDIEQERGITIMSKCTSVIYKGYKINVVDTPGHADFGGEVERIMSMVDGVCLVVCSTEGPMAQTKFVLQKALAQNNLPLVVINKADRPTSRLGEVENEIFDVFCALEPTDQQLDYPVLYASAREGWAVNNMSENKQKSVEKLLDAIIERVPPPRIEECNNQTAFCNLKMLVTQTESNQFFGRLLIGKIQKGSVKVGDKVQAINQEGKFIQINQIIKIFKKFGVNEAEIDEAYAGDIVSVAGLGDATVGATLNTPGHYEVIKTIPIDPPTLSIVVTFNDSPFQGKEGTKNTINQIVERLKKEADDDVSLRVKQDDQRNDLIEISGRGDLHLGILLEKMRREGFEIAAFPPQVLMKDSKEGLMEPIEKVEIECNPEHMTNIIDNIANRKGLLN